MKLEEYFNFFENRELDNFFSLLDRNSYIGKYNYVQEMLENEVPKWSIQTPIFIIAPTGSGKNTFVESIAKNNKREKILLLSNRVALNRQIKIRMIKNLEQDYLLDELTDKGLDRLENIGNVTVKTYHKFFIDTNLKKEQDEYKYIISDECHFLDSDSTFVPYTYEILKMIVKKRNSIRVYMTATPEYIFNSILSVELDYYRNSFANMINYTNYYENRFSPICYELKKDLELVDNLKFYRELADLIPLISSSSTKWFIFVDSIAECEKFCLLLSKIKKSYCLITSNSKNNKDEKSFKEFANITRKEAFDSDVIISTRTLENGVNLKILNLSNLVVNDIDYVSLLQKLGRKRKLNKNDKIDLFVKIPSLKEITIKKNNCEMQLQKMSYLKKMDIKYVDTFINSEDFVNSKNLCYVKDGKIVVNELAWKKLKRDYTFYEMLANAIQENKLAPALLIKHWIYKNYQEIVINEDEIINGFEERKKYIDLLCSFLDSYVDKKLDVDEVKIFRKEFMTLYLKYFKRENRRRTDRIFGKNIISTIIKELNLPYEIKNMDKKWFIKKEVVNHEAK